MHNDKRKYLTLFLSTLQLSAFTFGSGFVIVPLMRKKFVETLGWIDEQEMLDLTAIAQSSPGAIAVNAAILVGYRVAGGWGALLTVLGTLLPPFVTISVISLFYAAFRDNAIVSVAMNGMLAGVTAVICDVVITMITGIVQQRRILPVLILIGVFMATRFWGVNLGIMILICGALGIADTYRQEHPKKEERV